MKRKIDVRELSKLIDKIVKARSIQKAKVDTNNMLEEMQEEEVNKIVPAMEQSSTQTANSIELNNIIELLREQSLKDTSAILQLTSSIPQITSSLDPHKGLHFELLNCYKYFKPSELLSESNS
jgi:hypothetical protein